MRYNRIDIPKETLEHLYWEERLSMKAIAEKLGLSITPVYRSIERHNIRRRPQVEYKKIERAKLGISKELLENLYLTQQLPIVYIAQQLTVADKTIRKLLQDFEIQIRSRNEVQKLSAPKRLRDKDGHGRNWRGGQVHNANGYIMSWAPEHPRATGKQGYVYEHILIWEKISGRPLPKGWVVHHLNGIRDDNRPENLRGMPRGSHDKIMQPYKARIRQLEAELRELQQLKLTIG